MSATAGSSCRGADGSRTNTARIADAEGAPLQEIKAPTSLCATGEPAKSGRRLPDASPQDAPWTNIANYPATVMDNRVVYVDGVAYSIAGGNGTASTAKVYAYDPADSGVDREGEPARGPQRGRRRSGGWPGRGDRRLGGQWSEHEHVGVRPGG